jgi:hypothetical protein
MNEIVPLNFPKPKPKPIIQSRSSSLLSEPSERPVTIHSTDINLAGPYYRFEKNRFSLNDRFKFSANLSKLVKTFPTKDFNFTPSAKIIEDHQRLNSAGKKIRKFHTQNKFGHLKNSQFYFQNDEGGLEGGASSEPSENSEGGLQTPSSGKSLKIKPSTGENLQPTQIITMRENSQVLEGPLVQRWFEQLKKSKAKKETREIEANLPPGN